MNYVTRTYFPYSLKYSQENKVYYLQLLAQRMVATEEETLEVTFVVKKTLTQLCSFYTNFNHELRFASSCFLQRFSNNNRWKNTLKWKFKEKKFERKFFFILKDFDALCLCDYWCITNKFSAIFQFKKIFLHLVVKIIFLMTKCGAEKTFKRSSEMYASN